MTLTTYDWIQFFTFSDIMPQVYNSLLYKIHNLKVHSISPSHSFSPSLSLLLSLFLSLFSLFSYLILSIYLFLIFYIKFKTLSSFNQSPLIFLSLSPLFSFSLPYFDCLLCCFFFFLYISYVLYFPLYFTYLIFWSVFSKTIPFISIFSLSHWHLFLSTQNFRFLWFY